MKSHYQEVNTDDIEIFNEKKFVRSSLRQIFICSTMWTHFFMTGLCIGAPTVFLPQLRKELKSTDALDDELSSWLYVLPAFSSIPCAIILPLVTKLVGRKKPLVIAFFVSMSIFIILYWSTTPYHILISELLQGYMLASNATVGMMCITEFSSPKLRGFFLTFTAAVYYWGIWVSNAIGTFYHWKNIPLVGMIGTIYTITVVFWPESPLWLASKGRFEASSASFRWIFGFESENVLQELILVREEYLKLEITKTERSLLRAIRCPEFYMPLVVSIAVTFQFITSGKIVCCLYILDIFKIITSSETSAYMSMLILDGATVICIYIGTYLAKILKRRTLYMTSSFTGVFFLFSISLYLFLIRIKAFEVNNYIILALLIAFSVSISIGPMILSSILNAELISTKYQASSYAIVVSITGVSYTIWMKFTPKIFASIGLDGSFLFYAIACGLCTLFLYVYLPETKDKTQREIDDFFKDK